MPIYEYACERCGQTIEVIQRLADATPEIHDGCGGTLSKLISGPALRVKEQDGITGSTHSSIQRFQENQKIEAERKKKPPAPVMSKP
jgi:putative FmdB family regulatory protein